MGRVVVFLLIGSVLIFGVVLKTPLTPIFSSNQLIETIGPVNEPTHPKALRPSHKTIVRKASVRNLSLPPNGRTESTAGPIKASSKVPSSNRQVIRVLSDSAVHSFNSPASDVVKLLKKGDVVDKQLEVVDARGRWTLVKADPKGAGFVRSESLGPQLPAEAEHE